MTGKHTAGLTFAPAEQFPERPPRNNMQNSIHLNYPAY